MMKRFVLHIEYDGSDYAGFQLQPDRPSIQGKLEEALYGLYNVPVRVHPSGRTDAGVHAHYQIIHFDPPRDLKSLNLKAALNSLLPRDIRVINTAETDETFHARFSARKRRYRYIISARETAIDRFRVWQVRQAPDLSLLRSCADLLPGEHDFTSFCSSQAEVNHKRCYIYRSCWKKEEERYFYYIEGNRFLHSMVRSLVGTMLEVGRGRLKIKDFASLLELDPSSATALTAPPQGLSLMHVSYEHPLPWEKEFK
ncbi:MAG: tRNA pseudouridine(38-40) synthase TruA [Candidatus Marinimicrobia bacterium]|nr:tRNA pseudouridine(38-40) synthase TruA [Candidatus Neomarinimicrobiota bacterium]